MDKRQCEDCPYCGTILYAVETGECIVNLGGARDIPRNILIERLAGYAHNAWAGWMRYLFSKCAPLDWHSALVGMLAIPPESVERWTRQMNTEYADLPEHEKESDRKEATEILKVMELYHGEE